MKSPIRSLAPLAALAACSLALTACGSDTETNAKDTPKAAASLDEAKAVVVDYFAKAFVGDAAACDHESATYSAAMDKENDAANCAERVGSFKALMTDGKPIIDVAKTVVKVTENGTDGAKAEVTHELEGSGGTYLLTLQDGAWVITGEEGSDEGGDSGDSGDATPTRPEPRTVSEKEAVALERAFCQVKVGVTRAQVESWMGAPDEELVDDDGQPELSWYVNQDSYTTWLDADNKVASSSSSTPREAEVC